MRNFNPTRRRNSNKMMAKINKNIDITPSIKRVSIPNITTVNISIKTVN